MKMRLLLCTVLLLPVGCDPRGNDVPNERTIEYRGQHFRLAENFDDYEEYSDAMDPIAESEHDRVSEAVRSAVMPTTVDSVMGMSTAVSDVAFPGFQSGTLVVRDNAQFGEYYGMHAMIPYTEKSRFFIYKQQRDCLTLLHETELETFPMVSEFLVTDNEIQYFRTDGAVHAFEQNNRIAEP